MIRLFIATPLTAKTENKLEDIINDFKPKGGKIKYVDPKNIHLTLKFLGNTDHNKIQEIAQAIDNAVANYQPIETVLDQVGGFPNLRQPKVIWLGFK